MVVAWGIMWNFVAVAIALTAVYYVKKRAELTQAALEDIKKLAEETKSNLEAQIAEVLNNYSLKAEAQTRITQAAMPSLLQMMVENPDKFNHLMRAAEKVKKT